MQRHGSSKVPLLPLGSLPQYGRPDLLVNAAVLYAHREGAPERVYGMPWAGQAAVLLQMSVNHPQVGGLPVPVLRKPVRVSPEHLSGDTDKRNAPILPSLPLADISRRNVDIGDFLVGEDVRRVKAAELRGAATCFDQRQGDSARLDIEPGQGAGGQDPRLDPVCRKCL